MSQPVLSYQIYACRVETSHGVRRPFLPKSNLSGALQLAGGAGTMVDSIPKTKPAGYWYGRGEDLNRVHVETWFSFPGAFTTGGA
jgi:hypothetical protein